MARVCMERRQDKRFFLSKIIKFNFTQQMFMESTIYAFFTLFRSIS